MEQGTSERALFLPIAGSVAPLRALRTKNGRALRSRCFALAAFSLALEVLGCRTPSTEHREASVAVSNGVPLATAAPSATPAANSLNDLRRLFALSEPGEPFISDNVVSNETSLLQPADALTALSGGAYVGVGPEQNYTYIALSHPDIALIIDLRRDNALLHFLYKSRFEVASSRLEFICLLLGRPYNPKYEPEPSAHADAVLEAARAIAPNRDWFEAQQARSLDRITGYGLGLAPADMARIKHISQLFFVRQLELRFELLKANGRKYPTLESLWRLRSSSGLGTFLDTHQSFEVVRDLHRAHRIIPLVGDVSAPRPLGALADELRQRGLTLRTFYISNVEQYLIGKPSYEGWLRNIRQLPHDEQTLLLRNYLDQGRPHPRQAPGQRSTSLAHRLSVFLQNDQRPKTYFDIVTDERLLVSATHADGG
jgi:hypothetical protein